MSTFRILLAEDHPVFRMGISALIRSHPGWDVCGEAADGRESVKQCLQLRPDLLILDISMPSLNGQRSSSCNRIGPASAPVSLISFCMAISSPIPQIQ